MEIFDIPGREQLPRDAMEIIDRKQQEYKLIGSTRRVPGHTMFSLNMKTGEIKVAPLVERKVVDYMARTAVGNARIDIEPDCIYRQALNRKNFIKRLVREGILVRKPATETEQ